MFNFFCVIYTKRIFEKKYLFEKKNYFKPILFLHEWAYVHTLDYFSTQFPPIFKHLS